MGKFETLTQMLKDGAVPIDLRPADKQQEKGPVGGAISIPWADFEEKRASKLPKDKNTALIPYGARKGKDAAKILKADGYTNVVAAGGHNMVKAAKRGEPWEGKGDDDEEEED